jgi:hypothetical protein
MLGFKPGIAFLAWSSDFSPRMPPFAPGHVCFRLRKLESGLGCGGGAMERTQRKLIRVRSCFVFDWEAFRALSRAILFRPGLFSVALAEGELNPQDLHGGGST